MSWLDAVSAGVQAVGDIMQGNQQKSAYDYNAGVLDVQAQETVEAGKLQQEEMDEEFRSLQGRQQSAYVAAGVVSNSGSALDVMLNSATNFEFDKMVQNYNTQIAVNNLKSRANIDRYYGKVAQKQGQFQAGMTILNAGTKMADRVNFGSTPAALPESVLG